MFKRKFSTSDAYSFGFRNVLDNFLYFLVATVLGICITGAFLKFVGYLDSWDGLMKHFSELSKFFHESMKDAGGALGHSKHSHDVYTQKWIPAQISQFFTNLKLVHFHIDKSEIANYAKTLVPAALVFKFLLDVIGVGYIKMALKAQDKKKACHTDLYAHYMVVPKYFLVNLIVSTATVLCFVVASFALGAVNFGSMLFLLPGVFVYQRLRFAKFFVVDKNQSVDKALKSSWNATADCWANLTAFSVLEKIVNAFGHLLMLTSFLVFPLSYQVESHVYRQVTK
jgi:hypothetical protein